MNTSGGSLRNERITAMQDTLNKTFSDDPSYYSDVEVFNKDPLNCRIYDMTSATKGDGRMRIMSEYNRPVLVGDLVHWQEAWWICTHQQNIHDMFWNGVIERCNHLLKWKDSDGNIIERHCRAEDATKYTLGVTEQNNNVMLPDTRRSVLIPFDKDTVKLLDGRRLLIDKNVPVPKAYEITNVDRVTKMHGENGIIILTCGSSLLSANDNIELMIADYYAPTTQYTLKILNLPSPFVIKEGEDFSLRVNATKDNQPVLASEVTFVSSNPAIATINSQGLIHGVGVGKCTITVSLGDNSVVFEVETQDVSVEKMYSMSLTDTELDNEIIFGDEKQIAVKLFENDVELTDFIFECELLKADNIAEIKSVISEVVNHTVILKAIDNSDNVNKVFAVRVWSAAHSVEASLSIKVVGYF